MTPFGAPKRPNVVIVWGKLNKETAHEFAKNVRPKPVRSRHLRAVGKDRSLQTEREGQAILNRYATAKRQRQLTRWLFFECGHRGRGGSVPPFARLRRAAATWR